MNILITGAAGFIGKALCSRLTFDSKVIGVYHKKRPVASANIVLEQADPPATRCEALRAGLTDLNPVTAICKKYSPDVVIHCAGIAHQKIDPQTRLP
jgi:nucleoside-diphosphate-sugar epimerase